MWMNSLSSIDKVLVRDIIASALLPKETSDQLELLEQPFSAAQTRRLIDHIEQWMLSM
jgi:hypothetical protein